MEKLRRHRAARFQVRSPLMEQFAAVELPKIDPCFRRIVTFDYKGRTGVFCWVLEMDSKSRAFEAPVEATLTGTPLRCPRSMIAQPLVPWTMSRVFLAFLMALISVPAQLAPAVIKRRRA